MAEFAIKGCLEMLPEALSYSKAFLIATYEKNTNEEGCEE